MMQKIAAHVDAAEGGVQIRRIQEQSWKISCQRAFLEGSPYFFLQAEPLPEDMTRSEVVSFLAAKIFRRSISRNTSTPPFTKICSAMRLPILLC